MKQTSFILPVRALWDRIHRTSRHIIAMAITGFVLAVLCVTLLKTAAPVHFTYQSSSHPVNHPLAITLNQQLKNIDTTRITISPRVDGMWQLRRGNFTQPDQLVFTPAKYFTVNTTYEITVPAVERYLIGDRSTPVIRFTTEAAPSLLTSGLGELKDADTVAADLIFTAEFSAPNNELRQLTLRTDPQIELDMTDEQDTIFHWKPRSLLPQGTDLRVELYDTKNSTSLLTRTIKVAPEPTITSPAARSQIGQRDTFSLTFSQPIDAASSKYISFNTPGEGAWKSLTEYIYTPRDLRPGQVYSYKITPGLRSTTGGILTSEQMGTFTTIGAVRVVGASPHGNELAQGRQVITFTFDQPVDHASAESRVSVSSGTLQGFSWQGNTLLVTVTDLGFQRTVTARINTGVANAGFGLPSNDFYTHSFTTEIRSVRLSIPAYRQEHAGTCSAAALRMALAYRGIGSDEIGLVNAMGYAPRDRDNSTNPPTWDDPMQMFVGSIDGSIIAGTGAGPDAPPIAKASRAYGRSAQNFTGADAGWIAQQVYAGNPVLMFGSFRATGMISWHTPSGGTATMNQTGHVTVVVGVKGEPSAPLGFWVNDPLAGYTQYWSAGAVAANISRDPYRQAVVVY